MKEIFRKIFDMVRMRSLRARLFFILLIVGILPCVATRYAIVSNYQERAVERRINTIQTQMRIVSNHLLSNDYMTAMLEQSSPRTDKVIDAELEMLSNIYEGRVMIIAGNFHVIRDTYAIHEGKTMISGKTSGASTARATPTTMRRTTTSS